LGPNILLATLTTNADFRDQPLPSRAGIATLLKQAGLTRCYFTQARWFRNIGTNGFFRLESYQYYFSKHFAQRNKAIRFDPEGMALTCQPEDSDKTIRLPAQGVTKVELMGELAALQALLTYQLAIPCENNGTPCCYMTNSA
jgi:hypothetical protein